MRSGSASASEPACPRWDDGPCSDTAQRETTAIYAHRTARAMGYRAEPPPLPAETEDVADGLSEKNFSPNSSSF